MKRIKSCGNCTRGTANNFNKDILCRLKGVVSYDYVCQRHKPMPQGEKRDVQNKKCINCEFFIIDPNNADEPMNIGYCQLFTVRQFDGIMKNACSKFCQKSEQFIS